MWTSNSSFDTKLILQSLQLNPDCFIFDLDCSFTTGLLVCFISLVSLDSWFLCESTPDSSLSVLALHFSFESFSFNFWFSSSSLVHLVWTKFSFSDNRANSAQFQLKLPTGAELGNNAVNSGHLVQGQRTQPLGPTLAINVTFLKPFISCNVTVRLSELDGLTLPELGTAQSQLVYCQAQIQLAISVEIELS